MSTAPQITCNHVWKNTQAPILSVLIPFYKDDPQGLLMALSKAPSKGVAIILYDDGSQNASLDERIRCTVEGLPVPAQLITAQHNKGRSAARNALLGAARGKWVLFLDADMMPENPYFVQNWLNYIEEVKPAIAFGGFSVQPINDVEPALALHQAFSHNSDCLPAVTRAKNPTKHVCTSNLLVRRDVLADCAFDDGFSGWGWEDVEWAARAAKQYAIHHIDNPARHLGLESAETLVRRFRESAPNYARFVARHPELARSLPSWKAAHLLQKAPMVTVFKPLYALLAQDKSGLVPLKLRILALKLWRSCWYAKALS